MDKLEHKKYWIWLSLIKGLGSIKKQKLLKEFKTPEKIYNAQISKLLKVEDISKKIIDNINNSKQEEIIQNHIRYMEKNKIQIINYEDEEYPDNLKKIYDMPISLFIKGNKKILKGKNIAIIGCRECTQYGRKVAEYFSSNLSKNGFNIISGLAKGIDSYSHLGTLKAKGNTIAIIGNGLDTIYPKENKNLANNIINQNGAIISEYPCGTKPEKSNFPARNRIISGISKGVIVVEAKRKSGTLITVDHALEQGKDVFVVPGNINSINSVGTNDLIKQGAKIITKYNDILEEYKCPFRDSP